METENKIDKTNSRMKYLLIIFFTLCFSLCRSQQTDSTDIKLKHYKEMFVSGLITPQEYEQLKAKALGISAPLTQSVIVLPPAKEQHMDSTQLAKLKEAYQSKIAFGGVLMGIGAGFLGADIGIAFSKLTPPVGLYIALTTLGIAGIASGTPLLAVGVKQKHNYQEKIGNYIALNIGNTGIGLAYNF